MLHRFDPKIVLVLTITLAAIILSASLLSITLAQLGPQLVSLVISVFIASVISGLTWLIHKRLEDTDKVLK
jgi:hypothetical protein